MKCVIINLARATDRLSEIRKEFDRVSLAYEVWPAIDGQKLTESERAFVDSEARHALGLYPVPDGSLANTLTQHAVWRSLIASDLEMMAIFEDDARLDRNLPAVLDALQTLREGGDCFDIVMLNRAHPHKHYFPVTSLSLPTDHTLGRVRFASPGSCGYVITRTAAVHLLQHNPRMVREIDQVLTRFWDNGLNVLYVDPPVVSHAKVESLIAPSRDAVRSKRAHSPATIARQVMAAISRDVRRRIIFRRLLKGDRKNFNRNKILIRRPYPFCSERDRD